MEYLGRKNEARFLPNRNCVISAKKNYVIIGHDPIMTVFFNLPFPNKLTRCQNLPMGGQFLFRRFAMLNLAK